MSNHPCPSCGKEFDKIGSMRLHYTKKQDADHDGEISYENVECKECGTEFESLISREKKYCNSCWKGSVYMDEEDRRKIGDANRGNTHTEESKQKMSESSSGENASWYGITGEEHPNYGVSYDYTEEHKDKISKSLSGRKLSEEHKNNLSKSQKGHNHALSGEEHPMWNMTGSDNPNWNPESQSVTRYSEDFYDNRVKAMERDKYECRVCGKDNEKQKKDSGMSLHVHHITPRSEFIEDDMERPPNEAAELSNLFTVCSECHQKVECGEIEIPENGNWKNGLDW